VCKEPDRYQKYARTSAGVDTSKVLANPTFSRVHHIFNASMADMEPDVVASVQARRKAASNAGG
jgi:hypothetical protein